MFCPICGKDIDDGSTFCPECNNSIEPVDGADGNMPSQMIYNNDEDNLPDGGIREKKKGPALVSLIATIAIVAAVVLCICVLSVKKIVEHVVQGNAVSDVSAAVRKDVFESSAFKMEMQIEDKQNGTVETYVLVVDFGEDADDTDFYISNGNRAIASRGGVCYSTIGISSTDELWAIADTFVYQQTEGQEFNSEALLNTLIESGISETEFKTLYDNNKQYICAYFFGTGADYDPPAFEDVQSIFAEFLNGEVSKDAFSVTGKDGEYSFTLNTEAFLTEFFEYAQSSKSLEDHFSYWVSEERQQSLDEAIAYCAAEIPGITGEIQIDGDGYITTVTLDIAENYSVKINFSDINSAEVDESLCESVNNAD